MASAMRSSIMRQVCTAAPTSRLASTSAFAAPRMARAFQQPSFAKFNAPGALRVAAFHATSRRAILPPLPQQVQGTANDAVKVPEPESAHGVYHWTFERLVSLALVPVTIAPFAAGVSYPILDAAFCALLVMHTHIGFQSVIVDYLPRGRLPTIRPMFDYGVYLASAVVAYGLYQYETNDVGLTETVAKIWTA